MSDFGNKIYLLLRKYEQLFIGLLLGFLIFLALSLSAINIMLFMVLANLTFTVLIYASTFKSLPKISQDILRLGSVKEDPPKQRGRPVGAKDTHPRAKRTKETVPE